MASEIDVNSGTIKFDPPAELVLMIENENGERQVSKFKVDLVHLPDPERSDGYIWAEKEGIIVTWYHQNVVLGWEIYE